MLINNIDINKFNARVLDVNIQNSSISNTDSLEIINKLLPTFFKSKVSLNNITVTLLINSLDKKQYYLDKSNLLSNLQDPFEVYFKDRDLKFKCILSSQVDQASLKQIRGKLQLTMHGYNIENEVVESINRINSKTLNVKGNIEIPAILEINPSVDLIDLTINGLANDPIVIRNLKQGEKIIIDGKEGTVLEEGKNKFSDTEFWEFPFLSPGANTITLDKSNCDLTIKYEPRYL